MATEVDDQVLVYSIPEVAHILRISRSKARKMASNGDWPLLRIGTSVRVPKAALEAWIVDNVTHPGRKHEEEE